MNLAGKLSIIRPSTPDDIPLDGNGVILNVKQFRFVDIEV